jgi:high-affinity nickel-transport protein
MFDLLSESWHMYPLGVLFGLGFDTATEIGLLGMSATEASKGLPLWSVLVFPVLFAAGMSLVDTLDNFLMLGAYGWAFAEPIRKLYYNLTITFISVLVAILVGGIEALGLLRDQFQLSGPFWQIIVKFNQNFGALGYAVVALFAIAWALSILFYKWMRFEEPKIS